MDNNYKNYKRKYREMDDLVKKLISQSMRNYWRTLPSREKHTTMDELIGAKKDGTE